MNKPHLLLHAARMSARLVLHRLRTGIRAGSLLLLLSPLVLADGAAAADPPKDWHWLLPVQPFNSYPAGWDSVAFGNGRFVGSNGWVSRDGLNWTVTPTGTLDYFGSVTFDGVKFVASVGKRIGTSLDGTQWEFHPPTGVETTESLGKIEYLGGIFVGIGVDYAANAAVLYTSADGIQWTRRLRIDPPSLSGLITFDGAFAYGDGRFVLTGVEYNFSGEGIGYPFTCTSLDGSQWTKNPLPEVNDVEFGEIFHPIAHGNAGFMMADNGRILVSPDGISWEVRHELPKPERGRWNSYSIATIGNRVVCHFHQDTDEDDSWEYLGHLALASEDGFSWHETPLPWTPTSTYAQVVSDSSTFFIFGTDSVLYSSDGIAWTERIAPPHLHDPPTPSLRSVVYGDHGFVAAGDGGTVLTSVNGIDWERRASGTDRGLSSVVYGHGRYVASGGGGTIIHSPDGQTWTSVELEGVNLTLGPLSYGAGRFVVATPDIDTGVFWTSEDGINWQIRSSQSFRFTGGIRSLAFGNGRFVASGIHSDGLHGSHHAVSISEDGINWQRVVLPNTAVFRELIFDGTRFLALNQEVSALLTSPDGISWTTLDDGRYSAIGSGGGHLVAQRDYLLQSSPDGSSWTDATRYFSSRFLRFAYGAGRFVGVGSTYDGTAHLLVSGLTLPFAPPQLDLRSDVGMTLRVRGNIGSRWNLQRSATLQDWETVGRVTLGTEPLDIDVTPKTESHGFWRLAAPDQ